MIYFWYLNWSRGTKCLKKLAMWRHKNKELSISFSWVFFTTSPIISLIFMTSHGSLLTQFGLCPLRLPIQLIQVCIKILLPRHVATAEKKRKKWEANIKILPISSAPMINLKPPVLPTPKPYLTPSWRVSRRCPLRTLLDKSSKQWKIITDFKTEWIYI